LCAREWLDQCADIGDEGRIVAVEESLYIRQIRIEREIRRRREWEQRVLSEREVTANGGVVPVAGGVKGNERVIGVVATEEKYTDQRL